MPPMAGLHDICPSVSTLCVSNSVRAPMRAAGQRGLSAGVSAADDDHVIMFWGISRSTLRKGPRIIYPAPELYKN